MKSTDNMNETFVINLDKDNERFQNIKTNLEKNNIKFKRFPAVYGENINTNTINKYFKNDKLSKGQMGCSLSHIKLLQKISKENNMKKYIIMEDDAYIIDDSYYVLNKFLNMIDNWDLVYIGGNKIYGKKYKKNIIIPLNKEGYNFGTFGYVVNSKSAKKILDLILPMDKPIDKEFKSIYNKIKVYTIVPPIVKHNYNYESNILKRKRTGEEQLRDKIIIV